jgi:hypothetical protein
VEGIKIMRCRRIRKSRRIKIQPLCGEHLSLVPYLFLGGMKDFIKIQNHYFPLFMKH